jgi:hypothetical protein
VRRQQYCSESPLKAGAHSCCRYHGPRPAARENAVWVCNHTSMIDYIILTAYSPFAVIMQLHPGWVSTHGMLVACSGPKAASSSLRTAGSMQMRRWHIEFHVVPDGIMGSTAQQLLGCCVGRLCADGGAGLPGLPVVQSQRGESCQTLHPVSQHSARCMAPGTAGNGVLVVDCMSVRSLHVRRGAGAGQAAGCGADAEACCGRHIHAPAHLP